MSESLTERDSIERDRSMLTEISNEVVRVFKSQFGRGPTSARAAWAGPDALTVMLEDTLTPAERNMVRMGEHERLRETRMFFSTRRSASCASRSSG